MEQEVQLVHGDVVKAVINIALKSFRAPKDIKEDAAERIRVADGFWSPAIDDVTSSVNRFLRGSADWDSVVDPLGYAIEDVGSRMVGYYSEAWNFAPGYQVPKVSFPEEAPYSSFLAFQKMFPAVLAEVKAEKKRDTDREKARLQHTIDRVTDAQLRKLAEKIDLHWDRNFGPKMLANITKHPNRYELTSAAGSSEAALVAAIQEEKPYGIYYAGGVSFLLVWACNSVKLKTLHDAMTAVGANKAMAKKVAAYSKNLSRYVK